MVILKIKQLLYLLSVIALLTPKAFSEDKFNHHPKAMGVGSCSSSNCHGAVTSSNSSHAVLGNEFVTWLKFDKHSKAYSTLLSAESKKIGAHLGLLSPHEEKICLDCHATNSSHVGERFLKEDGVGCESCHGASENWLKVHTEKDTAHETNVQHGLTDLSDLTVRTKVCASCHFGDSDRELTHTLYGAGHPRLVFEQDTFEAVQPRHWKNDTTYSPIKGWFKGQITLAIMQAELIEKHFQSKTMFPEFSQFTCFSCHQDLKQKNFLKKDMSVSMVGLPTLNISHAQMVLISLKGSANKKALELQSIIASLKKEPSNDQIISIKNLLSSLNDENFTVTPEILYAEIKEYTLNAPSLDYQLAEQIVMAISAINDQKKIIQTTSIKKLYESVSDPIRFNEEEFRKLVRIIT